MIRHNREASKAIGALLKVNCVLSVNQSSGGNSEYWGGLGLTHVLRATGCDPLKATGLSAFGCYVFTLVK